MKSGKTEIAVLLDRSGSMQTIKTDMEGGFNNFIAEQRKLPGECEVSLFQFDNDYEVVYSNKAVADVPPLSLDPGGGTALLDAAGKAINEFGKHLSDTPEHDRPERVLFLILTDGQENSSKEFTKAQVKEMIEHQRGKYSWEFVFLGADENAFAEAQSMGIFVASAYTPDAAGTKKLWSNVSNSTAVYRSHGTYTMPKTTIDTPVDTVVPNITPDDSTTT